VNNIQELVDFLCKRILIHRTAIWLVPVNIIGKELEEAARLNIDAIDICNKYSLKIPKYSSYIGLSTYKLLKTLDDICDYTDMSECILVYNFDLLLSKLTKIERFQIWDQLYQCFPHRSRALIIMMPTTATNLLPNLEQIQMWITNDRCINGINTLEG
jgi:hypothetical protein